MPEAFLNVKSHTKIREVIAKNSSIKYIEYLGNIFDNVLCPSVIVQILHTGKPFDTRGLTVKINSKKFTIKTSRKINPNNFNFISDDSEYNLLEKIKNIPNKVTLKNNSKFALGIVTGDNKKYISDKKTTKNEPVIKGVNLSKYFYTTENYITFTPEKFQQTAPEELYRAKEKLFYRFISKELIFAYDNKQTLSLNSCNILIPQIKGLDIKYIMAVLNSKIMQFYFKKEFNSIKVLRSHLEQLPIPYIDIEEQTPIIELVNKILKSKPEEYNKLSEEINILISRLYGFDSDYFELI